MSNVGKVISICSVFFGRRYYVLSFVYEFSEFVQFECRVGFRFFFIREDWEVEEFV